MNRAVCHLARCSVVGIFAGLVALGCDPNAKANSNDRMVIAKDRLSSVHESCARTSDCAEGLRCTSQLCQSSNASVVGDYHAAVGARELGNGNVTAAIDAYAAAILRYKSDGVPVPVALHCGHGHAHAAAAQEPEMAEAAARSLYECARRAPVGSALRHRALADLANLGRAGLDPEHLGSKEPPPRFMTKQPSRPSTDKLVVTAKSDARKPGRSLNEVLAVVNSPATRTAMVPCWEQNWKSTREKKLQVVVQLKYRFIQGEYEEDDGYLLSVTSNPPAAGSAQRCVHDAVVAMAKGFAKSKRGPAWTSKITVAIGM